MDITPVTRSAVSDVVFGQLVAEILSGRLTPGDALPGERELAERFEVNRHAVREALKRVQQAGLVRISQGGKTRVLDWRGHAGLDTLSQLAAAGALTPLEILRDISEMRRSVAADAARLCAERASDDQIGIVLAAAQAYPIDSSAIADTFAPDLDFWTAVIEGSGNIAYRLGLNTLVAGFTEIGWQTVVDLGLGEEYVDRDAHQHLARLIADRDADGAQRLAADLLGRTVARIAAHL
ncbi:FadR/GntR family transcriptional regulator [Nocardioides acrostichi]|uniref:FadR family transcriptional regulator n=1 Tax=Nocardioides acrostichi TaxID=2784339 RepID=A0A930Y7Z2_9ACTN|nr:GntR family transcriptional regulator [Nocardioides acrostichi]MBF4163955.1 FadR family transcriptional regulator [Nocardioides acrostichi]